MLEETFKLFDNTMKMFDREMKEIFKKFQSSKSGKTKIKIKAGSKVIINNVPVELVNDAIILTADPNKLMGTYKDE